MSDFETLIGQALAKGVSPEDLAKQMSEALNKVNEQKKAAEAKAKELSYREKMIDDVDNAFTVHMEAGHFTTNDAVALTFLIIMKDTEFGKSIKSKEDVEALWDHICDTYRAIPETFKLKKGFKDIFGDIVDKLDFGQAVCLNKSKDTRGGSGRKDKTDTKSDADRIKEFLNSL